jgi:hypothetical protein
MNKVMQKVAVLGDEFRRCGLSVVGSEDRIDVGLLSKNLGNLLERSRANRKSASTKNRMLPCAAAAPRLRA